MSYDDDIAARAGARAVGKLLVYIVIGLFFVIISCIITCCKRLCRRRRNTGFPWRVLYIIIGLVTFVIPSIIWCCRRCSSHDRDAGAVLRTPRAASAMYPTQINSYSPTGAHYPRSRAPTQPICADSQVAIPMPAPPPRSYNMIGTERPNAPRTAPPPPPTVPSGAQSLIDAPPPSYECATSPATLSHKH